MTSGHLDPSCCHHVIFWLLGLLTLSEKIWDHCHRPNIPQINRKNCLKNHFWPLKSVFLALGSEERGLFLLGSRRLILTLLFPESEKYFEKFPMSTCFAYFFLSIERTFRTHVTSMRWRSWRWERTIWSHLRPFDGWGSTLTNNKLTFDAGNAGTIFYS